MASESMKMNMKGNMHSHVLTEFNSEVKFNFIVARSSKGPLPSCLTSWHPIVGRDRSKHFIKVLFNSKKPNTGVFFLPSQVISYIWNGNPEIGMLC